MPPVGGKFAVLTLTFAKTAAHTGCFATQQGRGQKAPPLLRLARQTAGKTFVIPVLQSGVRAFRIRRGGILRLAFGILGRRLCFTLCRGVALGGGLCIRIGRAVVCGGRLRPAHGGRNAGHDIHHIKRTQQLRIRRGGQVVCGGLLGGAVIPVAATGLHNNGGARRQRRAKRQHRCLLIYIKVQLLHGKLYGKGIVLRRAGRCAAVEIAEELPGGNFGFHAGARRGRFDLIFHRDVLPAHRDGGAVAARACGDGLAGGQCAIAAVGRLHAVNDGRGSRQQRTGIAQSGRVGRAVIVDIGRTEGD